MLRGGVYKYVRFFEWNTGFSSENILFVNAVSFEPVHFLQSLFNWWIGAFSITVNTTQISYIMSNIFVNLVRYVKDLDK